MPEEPPFDPAQLSADLAARTRAVADAAARDAKELSKTPDLARAADALARAAAEVARLAGDASPQP